jgi:predicted nucleic acid-binding protein
VAICELVLAELYRLLRNPVVVSRPLSALDAVHVIQRFRVHPRWKLIGFPEETRRLHDQLWKWAAAKDFAYRRLFDARLALVLQHHGVTEFATANVKDFGGFGLARVWNPLDG